VENPNKAEAIVLTHVQHVLADFNHDLFIKPVPTKQLTNKSISLKAYPGFEYRAELPNVTGLVRVFLIKKRIYSLGVMLIDEQQKYENTAIEVFNSFHILTEEEAKETIRKKVAAATPMSLPQGPIKQLKSDAEREHIKGKVKSIIEEVQEISVDGITKARKLSNEMYFNKNGNLVKSILYNSNGLPTDVTVYGYIDGNRVSRSRDISYETDLPAAMVMSSGETTKLNKPDPRYDVRYVYKYDKLGFLTDRFSYSNDGKLLTHRAYKRKGNKVEELMRSRNGALELIALITVDAEGNEIEEIHYNAPLEGWNTIYNRRYEFDDKGNWIKRTTKIYREFHGRQRFDSIYVYYRKIEYYT
jgi:hypothetical protein